jgi:2-phospho-L-lactate guanylyltransferase (CobY/MobA/RfbA family)
MESGSYLRGTRWRLRYEGDSLLEHHSGAQEMGLSSEMLSRSS